MSNSENIRNFEAYIAQAVGESGRTPDYQRKFIQAIAPARNVQPPSPPKVSGLHLKDAKYDEVDEVDRLVQKYFTDREYLKSDASGNLAERTSIHYASANACKPQSDIKIILLDDATEPPKFNGLANINASQPQERSPQQMLEDLKQTLARLKPKTVEAKAKEKLNFGDAVQFDQDTVEDCTVVAKYEVRSHSLQLVEGLVNSGGSDAIASTARMMVERYARWAEQQMRSARLPEASRLQHDMAHEHEMQQPEGWNALGMPIGEALQIARETLSSPSDRTYHNPCAEIMLPTVYEVPRYTLYGRHLDDGFKVGLGDETCINNAHSPHLQCAVNPTGNCAECPHYEKSE